MWAHGWGSRKHRGLRVWVLQLLERGPMNGAEIMDQMDRMTLGWWRPSPGSVYPLLEQLESEKLIVKDADGRYKLTEEARTGPAWMHGFGFPGGSGPRDAAEAAGELESYVRFLEDLARFEPTKVREVAPRLRGLARRLDTLGQTPGGAP